MVGAIVVVDSYRLGSKWGSDGPQSGYFPFYIGLADLHRERCHPGEDAVRNRSLAGTPFVYREQLKRVLTC